MFLNWQDLIEDINFKHQKCQIDPKNAMAYAFSLGQLLLEIKNLFSADEWKSWLQNNCHLSENCAETYLQIAKSWPSFRTQLDAYRKVDLSAIEDMMEDKSQMQFVPSEVKDNLLENVETEVNKIIPSFDNAEDFTTSQPESEESEKSENATVIRLYIPGKVVPK
ncbi:MAG: DUF3102 domain-containing protein, partial [Trichodesmium sp.]